MRTGKGIIFKNVGLEHFEHLSFDLLLLGSFNPIVQ